MHLAHEKGVCLVVEECCFNVGVAGALSSEVSVSASQAVDFQDLVSSSNRRNGALENTGPFLEGILHTHVHEKYSMNDTYMDLIAQQDCHSVA